jgi:hypothetical protein
MKMAHLITENNNGEQLYNNINNTIFSISRKTASYFGIIQYINGDR